MLIGGPRCFGRRVSSVADSKMVTLSAEGALTPLLEKKALYIVSMGMDDDKEPHVLILHAVFFG